MMLIGECFFVTHMSFEYSLWFLFVDFYSIPVCVCVCEYIDLCLCIHFLLLCFGSLFNFVVCHNLICLFFSYVIVLLFLRCLFVFS